MISELETKIVALTNKIEESSKELGIIAIVRSIPLISPSNYYYFDYFSVKMLIIIINIDHAVN